MEPIPVCATSLNQDPERQLRKLRARIGAYSLHAKYDSRQLTAKARSTFLQRFEDEVDPDRLLSSAERERRAAAARKAHFARLALASAKARAKRASGSVD